MRIHLGSLYRSWPSRISLLGAGASARLGYAVPHGFVVIGSSSTKRALTAVAVGLRKGQLRNVALGAGKKLRQRVSRALKRGRHVNAYIDVKATDRAGNRFPLD